jgi:fibronectin type 3 domain-containing protein
LSAVASEGAVSLIWEANPEADLAGYLVFRAEGGRPPQPLTPQPIKETTFRDATPTRGVRYVYTVVALDTAGNRSAPSNAVEESAR